MATTHTQSSRNATDSRARSANIQASIILNECTRMYAVGMIAAVGPEHLLDDFKTLLTSNQKNFFLFPVLIACLRLSNVHPRKKSCNPEVPDTLGQVSAESTTTSIGLCIASTFKAVIG